MGIMPWWSPATAIAPLALVNWVLFGIVVGLARPSIRLRLGEQTGEHDHRVEVLVFSLFALSGWVAILSGGEII
jgi:hypothetical protein